MLGNKVFEVWSLLINSSIKPVLSSVSSFYETPYKKAKHIFKTKFLS